MDRTRPEKIKRLAEELDWQDIADVIAKKAEPLDTLYLDMKLNTSLGFKLMTIEITIHGS